MAVIEYRHTCPDCKWTYTCDDERDYPYRCTDCGYKHMRMRLLFPSVEDCKVWPMEEISGDKKEKS